MIYKFQKKLGIKNFQTIVIFTFSESIKVPFIQKSLETKLKKRYKGLWNEKVIYKDVDPLADNVCIVGLGKRSELTPEKCRKCCADVYKLLKPLDSKTTHISLDLLTSLGSKSLDLVASVFEGFYLTGYNFDDFKSVDQKTKNKEFIFGSLGSALSQSVLKKLEESKVLMENVEFTRRLGDLPGSSLTPVDLADQIVKRSRSIKKLKVSVWDKARIRKEKMGGVLSVCAGGNKDPRVIVLEYKGAASSKKPVCFVGKGVTFDSGGLSLKPPKAMEEMKYDMCGSAAVAGAVLSIAQLKLKVNVVGLIASVENLTGPAATKPGDIVTAKNGKTVEVLNTDAEGRLILMDMLSYASSNVKPSVIYDAATLTGAVIVALSNVYTGVFTRDEKVWDNIFKASKETGEKMWRMPLSDEFRNDMKGNYADLQNISSYPGAGSSTAAAFLENFVDSKIPWAHFDIAGTAWNVGNRLSYCPKKGASGVLVRTFVELAKKG